MLKEHQQLLALLNSEETEFEFHHWYDKGEWIEVRGNNPNLGCFDFCTCDETSIRANYRIKEEDIDRTIVVDIEHQADDGCTLKIRALDGFILEIRKN